MLWNRLQDVNIPSANCSAKDSELKILTILVKNVSRACGTYDILTLYDIPAESMPFDWLLSISIYWPAVRGPRANSASINYAGA